LKVKVKDVKKYVDTSEEITVEGWVDIIRSQKSITFIELRDNSDFGIIQGVLKKEVHTQAQNQNICQEAAISLTGKVKSNLSVVKGQVEMIVSSFQVIGSSHPSFTSIKNPETHFSSPALHERRCLVLRDPIARKIFKLRSSIITQFRCFFEEESFIEAETPSIVTNQVEGGSTLFKLKYFEEEAFLTQSSQLYLEALVPVLGDCFCIQKSFRAEKSHTRRHLAEYSHLEMEMGFIDFEDLLKFVERTLIRTTELVLEKFAKEVESLNPGITERFSEIKLAYDERKGLRRMTHAEAIAYCNEHGIKNDEGKEFKEGEDISESPERAMVEKIGEPLLLINFPTEQKPFYMTRAKDNERVTESVDLLLPGVGEVLGGSMRESDYESLKKRFAEEGLDEGKYRWYLDLRRYGHSKTGGYGLGVERYLCWILGQENVRNVVLFPRTARMSSP